MLLPTGMFLIMLKFNDFKIYEKFDGVKMLGIVVKQERNSWKMVAIEGVKTVSKGT